MRKLISIFLVISISQACSILQTFQNVARLKYKIHSAVGYKVGGVEIANKKSLKDFSAVEMLKISTSILQGNLPLTFTLNIEAKNPNDGTGGYPRTDISIESFPYKFFINEKEILSGNIGNPISVPGKGESIIIPLNIEFDIAKSFREKSTNEILTLLLSLGGVDGSTANIKMLVKPVIGTPLGSLNYPDEITIVDKNFN